MRGTLEFTLPEESEEFADAQDGSALSGALSRFDNRLRHIEKHGTAKDRLLRVEIVREWLREDFGGLGPWR